MTTRKDLFLVDLFQQFIRDSVSGKRLKKDGKKIKPQTIENYNAVLLLLQEFEKHTSCKVRIKLVNSKNKRFLLVKKNYWKKFYMSFTDFMYRQKGCYDNYVGIVIKIIRIFFRYLQIEKMIPVGEFYKQFHIYREEIPIVTLLPEQLKFLINDRQFDEKLTTALIRTKNVFIFGCTVALRYSDLFNMKFTDIESINGNNYLSVKSKKTEIVTRIKLPEYVIEIIEQFKYKHGKRKTILPSISKNQLNKNLKLLAEKAGWKHELIKKRNRRGKEIDIVKADDKSNYRFCDLISSHTMRRTAVSTMLMLGMPELTVRKISGHTQNSKAFGRYVNLAQSYLDTHVDKVYSELQPTNNFVAQQNKLI
jgi:integrase